jgi:AcrR family transcriptional regulator
MNSSSALATAPPTLREQQRRNVSGAIVEAGRSLFAERGYAATTTTDIADLAGVSPATLFRHFASKSAIALAGLGQRATLVIDRLRQMPSRTDHITAARAVLAEVVDMAMLGPNDEVLGEIALVVATPELRPALDAMINAAADRTAWALAGRSQRPHPTLGDRTVAHAIVGAVQAAAEVWFEDPDATPFPQLVDDALALISPVSRPS